MVQDPVELVYGAGAEGVAHLGPVEGHTDHRQVLEPDAVLAPDAAPVVGDVREGLRPLLGGVRAGLGVGEAGHLPPAGGGEDLRDAAGQRVGGGGVHGLSVGVPGLVPPHVPVVFVVAPSSPGLRR